MGRGGSMHLVDLGVGMYGSTPIVGGSIPIGVGLGFATKMQKRNDLTIIFFGEGSTEEGVFAESINFAALKSLPILFVCENNFYSVYSPLDVRQPKERNRIKIVEAHGLGVNEGNGNDVEEVYALAQTAVNNIRNGRGPQYLEFVTYRHREHCGPNYDNDIGYRTESEFLKWKKRCPIEMQKKRIQHPIDTMQKGIQKEIDEAFAFAKKSRFPTFSEEAENAYA